MDHPILSRKGKGDEFVTLRWFVQMGLPFSLFSHSPRFDNDHAKDHGICF